jgi:serine protease Do
MKKFALSLLALLLVAATASAQPGLVMKLEGDRVAVIAKLKPAVVAIFAKGGQGGGTGVLISDDGYALTNFHVVQPIGPTMQCGLPDGVLYDSVLVGWDKVGDVALVKLLPKKEGQKFPYAVMADSDKVRQGNWSIAMGNPFLLATDFTPTVTFGLVSGVNRYQPPILGATMEYTDCIQIDTSINPGNSGGPLFNLQGEVIGINGRGSFDKRGAINSGVGYAISINQIKNFMGHLRAGLDVDHASLGALVRTETVNNGIGRTTVTTILEESDAYRRGLATEDEIVSFAGRLISSDNHYKNVTGLFPRGWRVPMEHRRGDAKNEILVRLMGVQRKELPDGTPPKDDPKKGGPKQGAVGPAANYYEAKAGFANYYFNRQEKARVFAGLKKLGDLSEQKGTWKIEGEARLFKAASDTKFTLELKHEIVDKIEKPLVTLKVGAFTESLEPLNQANNDVDRRKPNGSGGFMAAMYVWRDFLLMAEKAFTTDKCVHGGVEPIYPPAPDNSPVKNWMKQRVLAEVVTTQAGAYQTKWFFSKDDQKLLGFELRLGELNEDPCEVYLSDYRAVNGRQLPHRMQVYYHDVHYVTFTVKGYNLAAN